MTAEVLTVDEMYAADRFASEHGVASLELMEEAGLAVANEICKRWTPSSCAVLCGPGNNGGDGFVVARHLNARGWDVWVETAVDIARLKGDAAVMAGRWSGETISLDGGGRAAELVVDALFGAGLSRPLDGAVRRRVLDLKQQQCPVVAVDVPSGIHGDTAKAFDAVSIDATLTVTFFRKKPAHLLLPAALKCGDVVVADIGIPETAISAIKPKLFENGPALWRYPWPKSESHKYARGHCVVVSGPAHATGAARMAARGALRVGAGLVSVASPPDALAINAAALTAIMVKPCAGASGLAELLKDKRFNAVVVGPGCGVGSATKKLVAAALASGAACVLDADALTSFADNAEALFVLLRDPAVLTPHQGEFERLFPGLLAKSRNKVEAARAAAAQAKCTVLIKGSDTVVASPDGSAIVNSHAPPALATAGSGDVLAGFIGGLMAQSLNSFDATAMAVWLHAEAARMFGPGLIAEDLPEELPKVFRLLKDVER